MLRDQGSHRSASWPARDGARALSNAFVPSNDTEMTFDVADVCCMVRTTAMMGRGGKA
jgi:hypothetical protein